MFSVLRFFTLRRIIGLVLLILVIFWLRTGPGILGGHPEKAESRVLTKFRDTYPEISNWITQQQDRYGMYETAVAIQSSEVHHTLNPEALKQDLETRIRLVSIYQDDRAQDESLLWSHGTALDVMKGVPAESDRYLTELEEAQKDPDYWSLVRNDPIALTSKILHRDNEARAFYRSHQRWFGDMLEVLMLRLEIGTNPSEATTPEATDTKLIELDDLLVVATEGRPYLIQIVPEPKQTPIEACIYYETFRQFGEALVMAADQGVPVDEAVEVIVLNRDAIVGDSEEEAGAKVKEPVALATRLVQLSRERPSVWAAAQRDGYVLSFDNLVPGLSQAVLEKHPDLGVASLIVTQYRDVASQAAKIVDRYGELGVAVLVQYSGSERFVDLLTNPNVDHRVAMLAAIESDAGLEAVANNAAYLDKVIGENGDPKKPDWWINVPLVGGVANVARNYAKGYPSDWSEIGWAAWDVADIGLMAVSFGTSKIATTAAKQTAKGVGKKAATKLTAAGIKRAAPAAKQTAMRRMVSVLKESKVIAPLRWTARTTIHLGEVIKTTGARVVGAVNRVVEVAKSIPPGVRVWVARGLLATSLFVRGPKQVAAIWESLTEYVRDRTEDIVTMIPEAISQAMAQLSQDLRHGWSAGFPYVIHVLLVVVAVFFAGVLLFGPRQLPTFATIGFGRRSATREPSQRKRPKH